MLDFVKKFLTKREGKMKYNDLLKGFLSDGKLDADEKQELEKLAKEYGFSTEELLDAHKKASTLAFQNIIGDGKITEDEVFLLAVQVTIQISPTKKPEC